MKTKRWEQGDIDEKVILWLFFLLNLRDDKGWGTGNLKYTAPPLGSPGTSLACSIGL